MFKIENGRDLLHSGILFNKIPQLFSSFVEVRGPGVDRSLADPKVQGSNPGSAEI